MHSRIFEINTTPIDTEDRITEYSFEPGDVPMADSYDETDDREDDLAWLMDTFEEMAHGLVKRDGDAFTFLPGFKRAYFASEFKDFHRIAKRLAALTEEDFAEKSPGLDVMRLRDTFDDQFGFYIYVSEDGYCETIGDWVRWNVAEGNTYYVGGVIDYHA